MISTERRPRTRRRVPSAAMSSHTHRIETAGVEQVPLRLAEIDGALRVWRTWTLSAYIGPGQVLVAVSKAGERLAELEPMHAAERVELVVSSPLEVHGVVMSSEEARCPIR